jgi:hypothetical protein
MIRFIAPSVLLTTTLALVLPVQAAGSLIRTFVSSAGNDSNPCTITQPCATLAVAYAATAANGIIAALDPGKYGPLTITGPITVNGNGWAAITAPATGTGISIQANAGDNVMLIGLEIDGAGAGYNGIVFSSGGNLTIINCTLLNFVSSGPNITTGNGILITPTSGTVNFSIANTTASNNRESAIVYNSPSNASTSANGIIDHVVLTGNAVGIMFNSVGKAVFSVTNSTVSNNTVGVDVSVSPGTGPIEALISDSHVDNNNQGINASGPSNVTVRNVTVNQSLAGVTAFSEAAIYFSQTTITSVTLDQVPTGVQLAGGVAFSDQTSHLSPISGGSIGAWAVQ